MWAYKIKITLLIGMSVLISLFSYCWIMPVQNNLTIHPKSTVQITPDPYQQTLAKVLKAEQRINDLLSSNSPTPYLNYMDQAGLNADTHQYLDIPMQKTKFLTNQHLPNKRSHK